MLRLATFAASAIFLAACGSSPSEPELDQFDVSQLSGPWHLRATLTTPYVCSSDECHWYVDHGGETYQVQGTAEEVTGTVRLGVPTFDREDVNSSGTVSRYYEAAVTESALSLARTGYYRGAEFVAHDPADGARSPVDGARMEVRVRQEGDGHRVTLSAVLFQENVIDGAVAATVPHLDVFLSHPAAESPDSLGWVMRR